MTLGEETVGCGVERDVQAMSDADWAVTRGYECHPAYSVPTKLVDRASSSHIGLSFYSVNKRRDTCDFLSDDVRRVMFDAEKSELEWRSEAGVQHFAGERIYQVGECIPDLGIHLAPSSQLTSGATGSGTLDTRGHKQPLPRVKQPVDEKLLVPSGLKVVACVKGGYVALETGCAVEGLDPNSRSTDPADPWRVASLRSYHVLPEGKCIVGSGNVLLAPLSKHALLHRPDELDGVWATTALKKADQAVIDGLPQRWTFNEVDGYYHVMRASGVAAADDRFLVDPHTNTVRHDRGFSGMLSRTHGTGDGVVGDLEIHWMFPGGVNVVDRKYNGGAASSSSSSARVEHEDAASHYAKYGANENRVVLALGTSQYQDLAQVRCGAKHELVPSIGASTGAAWSRHSVWGMWPGVLLAMLPVLGAWVWSSASDSDSGYALFPGSGSLMPLDRLLPTATHVLALGGFLGVWILTLW